MTKVGDSRCLVQNPSTFRPPVDPRSVAVSGTLRILAQDLDKGFAWDGLKASWGLTARQVARVAWINATGWVDGAMQLASVSAEQADRRFGQPAR